MKAYIYPYKPGSASAKALADALGTKRIRHKNSKFIPRPHKLIVNWGSSSIPAALRAGEILNNPFAVEAASNKLSSFDLMSNKGVSIPWYCTEREDAVERMLEVGSTIVCRTLLTGHSGAGIVIASETGDLVDAPLYVEYVKKKEEYRIHIFKGEVILIQRKARRANVPDDEVNWQVRNHANGFIYQLNNINPPVAVVEQAVHAIAALSLDFGAVDVIYNEHKDLPVVLEVNCAPGLEGTTLERYVDAINAVTKAA